MNEGYAYDDDGIVEGYICQECGGDVLLRNGRTYCDWCDAYVQIEKYEPLTGWFTFGEGNDNEDSQG